MYVLLVTLIILPTASLRDHVQISPFNTNVRSVRSLMTPSPLSQNVRLNGDLMKASAAAIMLNLQPTSVKGSHLRQFTNILMSMCTEFHENILTIDKLQSVIKNDIILSIFFAQKRNIFTS